MGTEAAAGKNPVSHVGKIYSLLTHALAIRLYNQLPILQLVKLFAGTNGSREIGNKHMGQSAQSALINSQQLWFSTLVRLQGSVIPCVIPRVLVCTAFGILISGLYERGWAVSWPILGGIVPSIVLGLLLVFRTNTAYDRFWEGRKLWGTMINTARNLARQIWVAVSVEDERDRQTKHQAMHLIVAFAIATKLHLRGDPVNLELQPLLTPAQFQKLQTMNNPPLEVVFWLGDYLQVQQVKGKIHPYRLRSMTDLLDRLVDCLGGCERILKTPMPMAYSIHLKQLLLIYCLALPVQIVSELGGWTGLVVGLGVPT
jgi:putative membrane protein